MEPPISAPSTHGRCAFGLALATGVTLALDHGSAFAQTASATLRIQAVVVASCTTSGQQSSCSGQPLASQSNFENAAALITTAGEAVSVTQQGGLPPTIEKQGGQLLISF